MSEGLVLRKYFMNLTGQTYEELGGGLVRVTGRDGKSGVFHYDGRWVEGDVRDANANMLIFTGGPNIPKEFDCRWITLPSDTERESGWPEEQERYLKKHGLL